MKMVEEKLQRFREHINIPSVGRRLQVFFLLIILIAIPVTVFVAHQQQEFRQRAQGLPATPPATPPEPPTPTPILDSDNDNWSDVKERYIGTDPFDACPDNRQDPVWPPDLDNSKSVDKHDVQRMNQRLQLRASSPSAHYSARYDLTTDGRLTSADLTLLEAFLGNSCTN